MKSMSLKIERVSPALGARVVGVDLSRDLPPETWTTIERAFHDHSVLVFPAQRLSIEQMKRFARRFGEVQAHEHLLPWTKEGCPECMVLHNDAQRPPGLNAWHTDNSGWPEPPLGTVLYAEITPELGGDTLFSNMYLAYEALSGPMQRLLAGLSAVHDVKKAFGPEHRNLQASLSRAGIDANRHFDHHPPVEHPLVRTHPRTGRRALYVSSPYVTHIAGLSRAESRTILDFLHRHVEAQEIIYRHRWSRHDLLIWDNRCVQHLAVADYYPHERLMYRMNIAGERPFLSA